MSNAIKGRGFLGRGWAFPPQFSLATGEAAMLEEEEDIRNALFVLLSTCVGERVMRPEFGLTSSAFEPANQSLFGELKARVEEAIVFYEPRVRVTDIVLDSENISDGWLVVDIRYEIPQINSRGNLVYPFYREEGVNFGTSGLPAASA